MLYIPATRGAEHSRCIPHGLWRLGGVEMLWTILMIILVLWLIGFIADVGGGLIHLLLIVAGIVFLFQLLAGRRTVV
jgi:hypothetical protein